MCGSRGKEQGKTVGKLQKKDYNLKKIPHTERKFKNHKAILTAFLKGALY